MDGSFRDVVVSRPTNEDWTATLRLARTMGGRVTVDGEPAQFPDDIVTFRNLAMEHGVLLSIKTSGVVLNCHFFDDTEIEFDATPRELQSAAARHALWAFMRSIAKATGKPAFLAPEGGHDVALAIYLPADDQWEVLVAGPVAMFVMSARGWLAVVGRELGVSPDAVIHSLVAAARQPGGLREGAVTSDFLYFVHGIGCRLVLPDGSEIDLDVTAEGRPSFDAWRVQQWARSIGDEVPSDASIQEEAAALVEGGRLRIVGDGIWTWPADSDRSGDIPAR